MEVCRGMNAQGRWISQSGWGAYWSWDGNRENRLPRIYDAVCAVERGGEAPYDFEQNPVDAVVLNVGTNDASALSRLEGEEKERAAAAIRAAAADFLRQIRRHNPQAYILWSYGMCGGDIAPLLRSAVQEVRREGDQRVGYVQLPPCPEKGLGSRAHPGRENHRSAALAVMRRLKKALEGQPG